MKVFLDLYDAIEPLRDDERGRLFTAMLVYASGGGVVDMPGNERFLFPMIRAQLDRDRASYEDISAKRSAAGKSGALSRRKSGGVGSGGVVSSAGESAGGDGGAGDGSFIGVGGDGGFGIGGAGVIGGDGGEGGFGAGGDEAEGGGGAFDIICSQDDDDDDDYGDEDENQNDDDLYLTTTTTRARTHTARNAPPSFYEAIEYFRRSCDVDDPVWEAEKFIAYNAKRHWDCLPEWQLAADLWAARINSNGAIRADIDAFLNEKRRGK